MTLSQGDTITSNDEQLKIICLGDSAVGKSKLLERFLVDSYKGQQHSTYALNIFKYSTKIEGKNTTVEFWDTAGQERFNNIHPSYFHQAHACIMVFDATRKITYKNLDRWYQELREARQAIPCLCAVNKIDADLNITKKSFNFPKKHDMPLYFVSAANGSNVVRLFRDAIRLAHAYKSGDSQDFIDEILRELEDNSSKLNDTSLVPIVRRHPANYDDYSISSSPFAPIQNKLVETSSYTKSSVSYPSSESTITSATVLTTESNRKTHFCLKEVTSKTKKACIKSSCFHELSAKKQYEQKEEKYEFWYTLLIAEEWNFYNLLNDKYNNIQKENANEQEILKTYLNYIQEHIKLIRNNKDMNKIMFIYLNSVSLIKEQWQKFSRQKELLFTLFYHYERLLCQFNCLKTILEQQQQQSGIVLCAFVIDRFNCLLTQMKHDKSTVVQETTSVEYRLQKRLQPSTISVIDKRLLDEHLFLELSSLTYRVLLLFNDMLLICKPKIDGHISSFESVLKIYNTTSTILNIQHKPIMYHLIIGIDLQQHQKQNQLVLVLSIEEAIGISKTYCFLHPNKNFLLHYYHLLDNTICKSKKSHMNIYHEYRL
ncbi:unnamed protein product [Didymodactylos carnosus]|uniref:Uncharacterized protein n=1 Tax=Didymodactylos carnosus TaxID=1234261 RepID=A0A814K2Z5_9BILA|nr:unnamed protein product [Didymodactylos carnosus]CAF3815473.1 unnamed protein product [Didymodactylos carnosus]